MRCVIRAQVSAVTPPRGRVGPESVSEERPAEEEQLDLTNEILIRGNQSLDTEHSGLWLKQKRSTVRTAATALYKLTHADDWIKEVHLFILKCTLEEVVSLFFSGSLTLAERLHNILSSFHRATQGQNWGKRKGKRLKWHYRFYRMKTTFV